MSESKLSEFYIGCRNGDLVLVERLLSSLSFYDLNRIETNGSTGLHAATFYGHVDIVRRLVEHGAIVRTLKNKYNLTPAEEIINEEIKRLLQPDATYQPRKRFIDDNHDQDHEDNKQKTTPIFSATTLFSPVSTPSAKSETLNIEIVDEDESFEWLDAYDSAHRIAEENHEYMRKWLTKISLSTILKTINNDYIDNPNTELTDKHRTDIRTYIEMADIDDDPRHLVYVYTLQTNFYRQLNKDLAQRGSEFRFENIDVKKHDDDVPPVGFGQYLFAAVIIHHPVFIPFYYIGTTYRGMNLSRTDFSQYVPGARILTRSFLSTSKSVHLVSYYLQFDTPDIIPVLCIYRTTQSSPGPSVTIASLSAIPTEDEVLIFPFVAFRVVRIDIASFHFPEQGLATVMFLDQITNQSQPWPLCGLTEEQQHANYIRKTFIDVPLTEMASQETTTENVYSDPRSIVFTYEKHKQSTNEYIQSCLSFYSRSLYHHSLTIEVIKNITSKCLSTDSSLPLTTKDLEWLSSFINSNSLCISLEPVTQLLVRIPDEIDAMDADSDNSSTFVLANIEDVMSYENCCIILGKPGIGKTTLAQWITLKNAQTFSQISNENFKLTEINNVRLPIFICLTDLAQTLETHPNLALTDYICYLIGCKNGKNLARDYISNQHSIIVLDGLDQIVDTAAQNRIIQLIDQFIQTYILKSNTAFDQVTTEICSNDIKSRKVTGNQLIITTRWFANLSKSPIIKNPCYSLRPLSLSDTTHFIDHWFRQIAMQLSVESKISDTETEKPNVDYWHDQGKNLIKFVNMNLELQELLANPLLLVAACDLVTIQTLINPFSLLDKRVVFYHITCTLLSERAWQNLQNYTSMTKKQFEHFLLDIAAYIHQHSFSGSIEEFDMRLTCRSSMKVMSEEHMDVRPNRKIINDFLLRVSKNNIDPIVACGPDLYKFLYPAFQQYFTCLSILQRSVLNNDDRKSVIESTVNRILYHITDSRYREPLLLILSYISWQWTPSEIELFYEQLLSKEAVRFNRQLPLPAMLLMTALPELHSLPTMKILHLVFNQFMMTSTSRGWLTRFPIFIEHFINSLNNLPSSIAVHCLTNYLIGNTSTTSIREIVRVLLKVVYHTRQIPLFLRSDQDVTIFATLLQSQLSIDDDHEEDEDNVFAIDRLLTSISILDFEMLPDNRMRQYLAQSNIRLEKILPSVLSTIIALYGGLHRFVAHTNHESSSENIVFSPSHIHRTSTPTITSLLIDYINGIACNFVDLLAKRNCEDISTETIDLFVAWLCLEGVERPYIYESFLSWPAFSRALSKLRRVALYLSEYYHTRINLSCSANLETPSSSLFGEANQIIEQYIHILSQSNKDVHSNMDLFSFVSSICSAMCRLIFPGDRRTLFSSENDPTKGMLNLPLSDDFQQLLMSDEYSSKIYSQRLADHIRLVSPPFLPKELHPDMDDVVEQEQFQYETRPMLHYRHDPSFPLAILPPSLQPLFSCLFGYSSNGKNIDKHVQLPVACLLGEVARTLSRRREGNARYNLLLATLRFHFEEHHLTNCFTGLVYTTATPGLRSFFVPFDVYLAEQDQQTPFNLILDDEQQEDFLLHTALRQEGQRAQEARTKHEENGTNSLELYISAISLAAIMAATDLRKKDKRQSIVNDDEAIITALLISDPILRLHALTIIWQFEQIIPQQIERQWIPQTAFDLVSSVANQHETPVELHALVFLMFWSTFASMIPSQKSKQELNRLLDRLESSGKSVTAYIEQAVCKTLELTFDHDEFPFLRPRIYQFIRTSTWSSESHIVSQVLGYRSSPFMYYIQKWSTLNQKLSTLTFLASMYLMQLCIDANSLPMWFRQVTTNPNENDDNLHNIEKEIIFLFDTSEQPQLLTFEIATSIDRLLNENTLATTSNYSSIEHRLFQCSFVQSSALPLIVKWFQYKTHPYIRKFAYYAALLSVQRYPTSAALEICCDLLENDDDDLRQHAYQILTTIYQSSSRLGVHGLINLLKLALPSQQYYSALVYETISKIDLRIDSTESLQRLLNWERQRIKLLGTTAEMDAIELEDDFRLKGKDLHVSLLQYVYIDLLIPDIRNQFFTHAYEECQKIILTFDKIGKNDDEQQLYLVELVLYASRYWRDKVPEKMSIEENLFVDGLLQLLTEQHLRKLTVLSKVIVKALIVNRSDLPYIPRGTSKIAYQSVKNILTEVSQQCYDNNSSLSDDTISGLIKHYYHGDVRFPTDDTEQALKLLATLHANTSFPKKIKDATACALIRAQCFLSNLKPSLADLLNLFNGSYLRLYQSLMLLVDDSVTNRTIRLITLELIKKYDGELLPLFISDLCQVVDKFNIELQLSSSSSLNSTNHLKIATSVIKEISPTRFRELVCQQMHESDFKYAIYCISKQLDSRRRLICLEILTHLYGELTNEVNDMFYCAMWEKASDRQLAGACISNIRRVADRSVVEQLFSQLMTNRSRQRRYLSGLLLVQLARCDELSTTEVQRKLTEAIDSPLTILDNNKIDLMQEIENRITNERLDQALFNLLMQLSFIPKRISRQILNDNDYRQPDLTNFEEEFSRLVDADTYASCIVLPSLSNTLQESTDDTN